MFNLEHSGVKRSIGVPRVITWLTSGHSITARISILNHYNRKGPDPGHPNPDILICNTGKLGVDESLISGNWLVLFELPNSIITWKQIAARNVRLRMKETIHTTVPIALLRLHISSLTRLGPHLAQPGLNHEQDWIN